MVYNDLTFYTGGKEKNEKEKRNADLACAETLLTGNSNAKDRTYFSKHKKYHK